jgi:hypothetical protein
MQKLTQWILLLLALVTASGLSGAWTSSASRQGSQQHQARKIQGAGKSIKNQEKKKFQAALKAMPTLKTTLGEAVALAEKEAGGKAYEAALDQLNPERPMFLIRLVVGEKPAAAVVDPETKKVTVRKEDELKKEDEEHEGHEGQGDDGDGDEDG